MSDLTDEKILITAIKSGDSVAFKQLCEIYYKPIYLFLWRKTRDAETSKDLVQDLFVNVWKLHRQLDDTKSIKSYLYKSANNLAINHLKQKVSKHNYDRDRDIESLDLKEVGPNELSEYLDDVLCDIPDAQRTVFILNKFEGFKYYEIAEVMDISVKTVESRMSKVLKVLREKFAPMLILFIFLSCMIGFF